MVVWTVLIVGLVLLGWGWHGRKVDDQPLCGKCGYDVSGTWPGGDRCTECGAELGLARAIRYGHRQKNLAMLGIGLILAIPSTGRLGLTAIESAEAFKFRSREPIWLLLQELPSADGNTRDAIQVEFLQRLKAGQLTPAEINELVAYALKSEADPDQLDQWKDNHPSWIIFMDEAESRGVLSVRQWQLYQQQTIGFDFWLRSQIAQGDPLPFEFAVHWVHPYYSHGTKYTLAFWIDDVPVALDLGNFRGNQQTSDPRQMGRVDPVDLAKLPLTVGRHHARLQINANLYAIIMLPTGPPAATSQINLLADFDVLPANQSTVRFLLSNPGQNDVSLMRIVVSSADNGNSLVGLTFSAVLSNSAAYEVFLKSGDQQFDVGPMYIENGAESGFVEGKVTGHVEDRVDVILRPSLQAAKNSVNITEITNLPATFANVHVQRP